MTLDGRPAPLRCRPAGSGQELVQVTVGVDGVPLAWNPKLVDALAARAPL